MGTSADGRRRVTVDPDRIDDRDCTVLHIDMDAFFASVELRRRPELRGRPMMVAGSGPRSVVLSATYEARAFGVRSAMPVGRARAMCPGMAVVDPDPGAYRAASAAVMAIFADVTPLVEQVSVDEAFLDVSGAGRVAGRPARIAQDVRRRIRDELELSATVGASSTKFVAKLASSLAKPDGLLLVPPSEVLALLHPLPVRALWGVGPRTADRLREFGLSCVGEVAGAGRATLVRLLGNAAGGAVHELAWGRDPRPVEPETTEASIGAETTFDVDLIDRTVLRRELLALADRTCRRARSAGLRGRTVSIKIRFADFTTVTRSVTLDSPTNLTKTVHTAALTLLDRVGAGVRSIRLVGVRLEHLLAADQVTEQLSFDAEPSGPGWAEAESAVDRIAARFGATAVRPAALVDRPAAPS
jgi:DNA polymerase-4